jgi:two-component system sensor histidine kinase PilS (NtrC family)
MNTQTADEGGELRAKLKWLVFSRAVFAALLFGSTLFIHLHNPTQEFLRPVHVLYALCGGIGLLTAIYAVLASRLQGLAPLAYAQVGLDTLMVTLVILVTGGFGSVFSFLYLVVIIYASMLVYRRGSLMVAAFCSAQYAILGYLEFFGILQPLSAGSATLAAAASWTYVVYKILITAAAAFAVALLSSHLAEQARRTRRELRLMEEQVRRVEKMAAVGEMGAGLAHEIKNPLASITGSIQLLREEIPYDAARDKLMQIILREADRLSALVSNFLLFARPPEGRRQPIDLDRAIPETVALMEKNKSRFQHIRIQISGARGAWIEMDPDHFRQVLWNLLLNAAEAIHGVDGRIDINLALGREPYVRLRISDNGCGIPQEHLKSIFDPFFTSKPSGTGLGLSIVHSIMDASSGRMEVESLPGRGTTITLTLKRIAPPSGP